MRYINAKETSTTYVKQGLLHNVQAFDMNII